MYIKNNLISTLLFISILCVPLFGISKTSLLHEIKQNKDDFTFSPKGCEFKIDFPKKPDISNVERYNKVYGNILVKRANLVSGEKYSLMAECSKSPHNLSRISKEEGYKPLINVAKSISLNNTEYSYDERENQKIYKLEGYLDGLKVVFVSRYGSNSLLTAMARFKEAENPFNRWVEGNPHKVAMDFIRSIALRE